MRIFFFFKKKAWLLLTIHITQQVTKTTRKPDRGEGAADLHDTCSEGECGIAAGRDLRLKCSGTSLLSMGTAGDPLGPAQVVCASPMSAEGRAFVPEMRKPEQMLLPICYKGFNKGPL